MVSIKSNKTTVTIKDGDKLVSYPTGTFVIYKEAADKIALISTISSFRHTAVFSDITPRFTKNFTSHDPSEEDSIDGKEGEIWYNQKQSKAFIHDGKSYKATSIPNVIELYLHELSSYVNGETEFLNLKV